LIVRFAECVGLRAGADIAWLRVRDIALSKTNGAAPTGSTIETISVGSRAREYGCPKSSS